MPSFGRIALAVALAAASCASFLTAPPRAAADSVTISAGPLRTGWDPNEPGLTPGAVASNRFGQLYATRLTDPPGDAHPGGQVVYAQPVTWHGVVVVATEKDRVFGIDESTGQVRWADTVGTYEPDDRGCGQVTPYLGITSTPVVDPATGTVYVMARDYLGGGSAAWRLHALSVTTGVERAGWPVTVSGSAWNGGRPAFDPTIHQQRPALLLLDGGVFAGFGSFCDAGSYRGWIFGVSAANPSLRSLYTTEPSGSEGALWAAGGGFLADSPTSFIAATANGTGAADQPPLPSSGTSASGGTNLADSVVRFQIQGDGVTVVPSDFFGRGQTDSNDSDLGSSQVSALPDELGISGHPHLAVVGGKFGTLYVLDRDNLGGRHTGDTGAVSVLTGTDDLFGHVASWPADGGFVYDAGTGDLNAFRLSSTGQLQLAAGVNIAYGSGSPLITSAGTTAGSATLWLYERGSGQLRAYAAADIGAGPLRAYTIGIAAGPTKFIDVAADQGRILAAADDGFLHVYGLLPSPPTQGYWLVARDGGIFPFGLATGHGSTGGIHLNAPIVAMAATSDGGGYWLVASDGGIFPFGDATGYGSLGSVRLNAPIVGMAAAPDGRGYWLVAADGGVFPFGPGARGFGSTGGIRLNSPVVGMAATPRGDGYWLVAGDGGIFPFGPGATGWGSTGGTHLNQPVVGMAASPRGGYWLVASDGGIFPFGPGATGYGSTGGIRLNAPIVGMAATHDGGGYWLVASDGGIFPFGPGASGWGSTGGMRLNAPVVGMAGIG